MRRGSNLLLLMMLVYLGIAAAALLLFGRTKLTNATGEEKAALDGRITGDVSDGISEETKERLEDIGENPDLSDEAEDETDMTDVSESPVEEEHYYRFRASHSSQGLRVREEPSLSGKILGRIDPGREGYVLEKGEAWSKIISADGRYQGYCFNEYLAFTDITKEEYDAGLIAAGYITDQNAEDTLLDLGATTGTDTTKTANTSSGSTQSTDATEGAEVTVGGAEGE